MYSRSKWACVSRGGAGVSIGGGMGDASALGGGHGVAPGV